MALRIAFSGFIALIVAIGIGRFAFTPQVPLMLMEHQVTLTEVGIVAALNYLGYICGAHDAMRSTTHVERRLWCGLWGVVLLTCLSALVTGVVWHGLIRFVIGWASGWAMVLVAAWSNERLAHYGRPMLSTAVFAGPGFGILFSGILAVVINHFALTASSAWWVYGVLALLLVVLITPHLPRSGSLHRPNVVAEPLVLTPELKRLAWSYGLAGFGYILPATFLSQMAVARFPGTLLAYYLWPIFGLASIVGIAVGIMTHRYLTTPTRLALNLLVQAVGIICSEAIPGVLGMAIGALLVGGTFMNIVQLSLQYGRELAPQHTRYIAGLLTSAYALGQLLGLLLSAISTALTHRLEPVLYISMVVLFVASVLVIPRRGDGVKSSAG